MNPRELREILEKLLDLPGETEVVEFKEAKIDFHFDKLGKYFSALSNEANLKNQNQGWLVFGINNQHQIVGSQYRKDRKNLDNLKAEIAQNSTGGITFMEIHELELPEGRVILFQVPSAPKGFPIAWNGHYYARNGEQLSPLNIQEIEQIRSQVMDDWSAQVCEKASLKHLDPLAIKKAREEYRKKLLKSHSNPHLAKEINSWDDLAFLNKSRLLQDGKVTNTAILLLGKEEFCYLVSPSIAQITWVVKDEKGIDKDYEHFAPPFILSVEKVLSQVRNLNVRFLPAGTLFPIYITQYDSWVIREALHNAIAHQDYRMRGRISVVETPSELIFTNLGSFAPGTVENAIRQNAPIASYRNPFLAQAMVNLGMIDNIGSGIRTMFHVQKERYFPLPDYDLSKPNQVEVSIPGKILDSNYTQVLINKTDLDIFTVILIDKVQKKKKITRDEHKLLRKQKLTEGRYPNLYVSAKIASVTDEKASYVKNKGLDNDYYQRLLISFIEQYGSATRREVDELLINKLPEIYTPEQKRRKIGKLLFVMSKEKGLIHNIGSRKFPKWALIKK